jgi:hypothetical protein
LKAKRIVRQHHQRLAPLLDATRQAQPGTIGIFPRPGQAGDLGAGAVVFDLKHHHDRAVGQRMLERVDLPQVVGGRELEPTPR